MARYRLLRPAYVQDAMRPYGYEFDTNLPKAPHWEHIGESLPVVDEAPPKEDEVEQKPIGESLPVIDEAPPTEEDEVEQKPKGKKAKETSE